MTTGHEVEARSGTASVRDGLVGDQPPPLEVEMYRGATAIVASVGENLPDLLGWSPADLVGQPSTTLIHPADQNAAVSNWFAMIGDPGREYFWRGRYRALDGTWRWVETVNVYDPDAADAEKVWTRIRPVAVTQVSLEERLQEREQLLGRLSDALPVGVFQFDTERRVTFTNDRLHAILGETLMAATTDALFATVETECRGQLELALGAVLADRAVPDFEIVLRPVAADGGTEADRVCSVALRTLTGLGDEVTGGVGCVSDVTERVQLHRTLEHRASTDELTGCLNRATTLDALTRQLTDGRSGVAVVFIDLDRFKEVNDRLGHSAGDAVLREAARRLTSCARAADHVGRLGGDEFLVICPGAFEADGLDRLSRRFVSALAGELLLDQDAVTIQASAGAAWAAPGHGAEALISEADRAMYAAKNAR